MAQKTAQILPQIGYLYHYPRLDHPTDNFRLDIHITTAPTNQHFDVLRLTLPVKTDTAQIKRLKVGHPWHFEKSIGVSAGTVVLEDRKGKKEEAFTFGGHLTIANQAEQTFCVLVSAAPILEISGATPLHLQFIEEVEIVLAKQQTQYPHHRAYEKQLNQTDALGLYLACLAALLQKYAHFPHKTQRQYRFLVYLHSEKQRLVAAGLTRNPLPQLDDLFDN